MRSPVETVPGPRGAIRSLAVAAALAVATLAAGPASAEVHRQDFDAGPPSWRPEFDKSAVRTIDHRRQQHMLHGGSGAELYQATVGRAGGELRLVHSLPPATVIEDLSLAVWVKSNRAGATLHLRLVFPDQTDPETGAPLTVLLAGERYSTPGQWQRLACATDAKSVQDELRRARYRLAGQELVSRGLFADQAVLVAPAAGGSVEFLFDDLAFGPIVEPQKAVTVLSAAFDVPEPDRPAELRLNRLEVEGRPFFPRMTLHYGDSAAALRDAGINVAWVPDYRKDGLLEEFRDAGLWATATPPRASDAEGRVLGAREAGLLPFGPETRPVLFWNLGARIEPRKIEELEGWLKQIRAADGVYNRPAIADVTGAERTFSRQESLMLAASRHITHTGIPYNAYRDWLESRRLAAWPGTFFWTWLQTEPHGQLAATRAAAGRTPLVIEPEQIRLQVYSALAVGCRGVGYWKTTPIDDGGPEAEERRLAITQLNLELELLEPLLATATPAGRPVPFAVFPRSPGSSGRRTQPGLEPVELTGTKRATTPFAPKERPPGILDAAVLRTEVGTLLLPVWYGESAQFCPGRMAENDVTIVVPGIDQTAAAWQITTTGPKNLKCERVAGGKKVTIPKFDVTAAILFTADRDAVLKLEIAAQRLAGPSAAAAVRLARLKRDRVLPVHQELTSMRHGLPDGPSQVRLVNDLVAQAEAALSRGRPEDLSVAKEKGDDALQALRALQRAHWEDAVRRLSSPQTSPHAISFSTLPDHYRLVARFGGSEMTRVEEGNVLPSGDFEDDIAMVEAGWEHAGGTASVMTAGAYVSKAAPKAGKSSLQLSMTRMRAGRPSVLLDDSPVTVRSPRIPVKAGQVLHISGWVRMPVPIAEHLDGATLHDNLLGSSAGLRWTRTKENGWERFELLREVIEDGDLVLTLGLHGEGEAYFDDLKVVPHDPNPAVAERAEPTRTTSRFEGLFDGLPRLPVRR